MVLILLKFVFAFLKIITIIIIILFRSENQKQKRIYQTIKGITITNMIKHINNQNLKNHFLPHLKRGHQYTYQYI